ncbi:MAG TPA: hemerythrin domain-containing protein, partial [Candidatus Nitrosotenuis sp.]|nr:hemerythrin domain-containing protein [Candidatus Nitrosotenuis sp.]
IIPLEGRGWHNKGTPTGEKPFVKTPRKLLAEDYRCLDLLLRLAKRLLKMGQGGPAEVIMGLIEDELQHRQGLEEKKFFPVYAQLSLDPERLVPELLEEHRAIERHVQSIRADLSRGEPLEAVWLEVHALQKELEAHRRREERSVLPFMDKVARLNRICFDEISS